MKFTLKVKQKLSVTEYGEAKAVISAGAEGCFEADSITFARRDCNAYIRDWVSGMGMRLRTQKDWVKNPKTKQFEKQVMVQNGSSPETYVFVIEE
ncbi:hypothetical protein SAMN02910317_01386 [Ruminococcaceae bacterium FB2012]|nr:hypothetical protein SAMN02910317_01386 [Ruminococcaceae bacterium FB2012]